MTKILRLFIGVFWQLPMAVLSFCFYRTVRWVMCQIVAKKKNKARTAKGDAFLWIELSEAMQNIPLIRPYNMVTGPRWNCHALMLVAGLFKVRSNIEIQLETARKSAKQWTIVIYSKDYQTTSYISSTAVPEDQSWYKIDLKTNNCMICIRYYNVQNEISCPAVKIDGELRIKTQPLLDNQKQLYENYLNSIRNYHSLFYLGLHYYVYPLLQWRSCFPEKFVKKEYLPMGNPETKFYFGSIKKGEFLQVDLYRELFNEANIYITFLNLCSFPVFWETISQLGYSSERMPCNATYLIRIHYKGQQSGNEIFLNATVSS